MRSFSAVAELLARSSATAEKQRVSCSCLPRLARFIVQLLHFKLLTTSISQ